MRDGRGLPRMSWLPKASDGRRSQNSGSRRMLNRTCQAEAECGLRAHRARSDVRRLLDPEHTGPERAWEAIDRRNVRQLTRYRCCCRPDQLDRIGRSTSRLRRVGLLSSQERMVPSLQSHRGAMRWTKSSLVGDGAIPWMKRERNCLGSLQKARFARVLSQPLIRKKRNDKKERPLATGPNLGCRVILTGHGRVRLCHSSGLGMSSHWRSTVWIV